MRKSLAIFILLLSFALFSCETIYNYDLSIEGIDSLPSTKSCIEKYIPKSVDAHKGRQYSVIESLSYELNKYESEIIDSLFADSIRIDSQYILKFIILGVDPFDEITEVEVSRTYFLESN
jgi:hypothetical protein